MVMNLKVMKMRKVFQIVISRSYLNDIDIKVKYIFFKIDLKYDFEIILESPINPETQMSRELDLNNIKPPISNDSS